MPRGRIIRSISGFYDVDDGSRIIRCRAKGTFRKKNITPLVGDEVVFVPQGMIEEVLPRRNRLIRPTVANVDQAVIVFAAVYPQPNWMLMEHFLVMVQQQQIRPLLCINKWDQTQQESPEAQETIQAAFRYEKAGFRVLRTCTISGLGIEELRSEFAGKISVLAGPSGVGKSSLLNAVAPGLFLQTGTLSERIQRGKNTTRCAELLKLPGEGGFVADTPGFTALKLSGLTSGELALYYPEFAPYIGDCYFQGCSHISEPGCAVLEAVRQGKIDTARHERYCEIWKELRQEEAQEVTK